MLSLLDSRPTLVKLALILTVLLYRHSLPLNHHWHHLRQLTQHILL